MRKFTYSEIIEKLTDFEPTTVIFSDERGRISTVIENITGPSAPLDGCPEVFFLVEEWVSKDSLTNPKMVRTKNPKRVRSLQEALFFLDIHKEKRYHPHGPDGGLGRPDALDAVDDDEGEF